jgi:transcriptional regulator with XRE-family HTH domain
VRLEAASTLRSTMAAAPVLTLIGQTLREMRTVRGMTQQQLADLCEMHRTFIISIEKGRQNASALTLVRLAAALGVLPAELFRAFTKHVMRSVS